MLSAEQNLQKQLYQLDIKKDKEFEIFVLHAVNDYTFEEIAKLKHRPLGTILWSYNNAIKKIQKELADEIN